MLPPSVLVSLGDVVAGISVPAETLPGPSVRINVVALGEPVISVSGEVLPSVKDVAALGDAVARSPMIGAVMTDGEDVVVLVPVGVGVTVGVLVSTLKVAIDVGAYVCCAEDNKTPSAKKQTSRYAAPGSLHLAVIMFKWISV